MTQAAYLESYQASDIEVNTNPPGYGTDRNTTLGTTVIDYELENDPVLNQILNSGGNLKGETIKVREQGKKGWQFRHREPIDSGEFWEKIGTLNEDN